MDSAAATIFAGPNPKLIFMLIDPVADEQSRQAQIEAYNRLRSLIFDVRANDYVTMRIIGIHFIVTKADMLGDNREAKAKEAVDTIFNKASREAFVKKCREYNINGPTGVPQTFCFSLGRFNVGNIFTYNPTDSSALLSTISDYCLASKPGCFLSRLFNPFKKRRS